MLPDKKQLFLNLKTYNMKKIQVKVSELTTNHQLQLEDGSWQNILSINRGFYFNSKLITYVNGLWSCLLNSDKVEAIFIEPINE